MLDAYIKIEDIKKLLDEASPINGLIKRSDFQKAVTRLSEFKKPEIKPKIRIKNRQILIEMIERHIRNVRDKNKTPGIIIMLEHLIEMTLTNKKVEIFETDFWDEEDIKGKIDTSNIALDKKEVMEILNISKPTFIRFEKLGILKKHDITISVYVNDVLHLSRHTLYFYKLNDIIRNLHT